MTVRCWRCGRTVDEGLAFFDGDVEVYCEKCYEAIGGFDGQDFLDSYLLALYDGGEGW